MFIEWLNRNIIKVITSFLFITAFCVALQIPVLTQIFAFLLITLIPGYLLLIILRINHINSVDKLLYSVGLSLLFDMFLGAAANFILPLFGVAHPLTAIPLTILLTISIVLLLVLAWWISKNKVPAVRRSIPAQGTLQTAMGSLNNNYRPYLLALSLPLISILGTLLINRYENNIVIFILLFLVTLIISFSLFTGFPQPAAQPFFIFMLSLALLYQTSLISINLVGSDVHIEYFHAFSVINKGFWEYSLPGQVNSCMSITILAPMYSILLNLDIVWIFKAVFPLLFALVPVTLYRFFRIQFGVKAAFLSVLFFITMPMFTMDMVQVNRQQVSELFFSLVILLFTDRRITSSAKSILLCLFGFGIIVTHYGIGTAYVGYLLLGSLLAVIIRSRFGRSVWRFFTGKTNDLPVDEYNSPPIPPKTLALICFLTVLFMLIYYRLVASGSASASFDTVSSTAASAVSGQGLFDLSNKESLALTALGIDFARASAPGQIWRIIQMSVELLLIIGLIGLILRPAKVGAGVKVEYLSFIVVSFVILLGVYILPTRSYNLGASRVFQITLLLVSPMFILGAQIVARLIGFLLQHCAQLLDRTWQQKTTPLIGNIIIFIVFVPYFIFNSGAIFELGKYSLKAFIDLPYSISLSNNRADISTALSLNDLSAADWLAGSIRPGYIVTADYNGICLLWQHGFGYPGKPRQEIKDNMDKVACPGYLFLRKLNNERGDVTVSTDYAARKSVRLSDIAAVNSLVSNGDLVYNNGAKIYVKEWCDH